jgi:NifU-like protein
VPVYPKKIARYALRPGRIGTPNPSNGIGRAVNFECGSFIEFSLRVDVSEKKIVDAGFHTNGCGYVIAASEIVAELARGKRLTDLHGVDPDEFGFRIQEHLGLFPEDRGACQDVVIEAFRRALADHRSRRVEEFRGETALICSCFGVSEERIVELIEANSAVGVDDIAATCNAGTGCGSCRMLIQELIDNFGSRHK